MENESQNLGHCGGRPLVNTRIADLALVNPILAATLCCVGWDRGGYVACQAGWTIINVTARWESLAADQTIEGRVVGDLCWDYWLQEVVYTVQRPAFQAGSPWKGFWDYHHARNPLIDLRLTIRSYCDWVIAEEPTPIENVAQKFNCECVPMGIVLAGIAPVHCRTRFDAFFTNLRALSTDENPTDVTLSFHAVRLPNNQYSTFTYESACEELLKRGYLPA